MTLPANIRVNLGAPFPSLVKGSGPVAISKKNGIWTVSFSVTQLGVLVAGTDPTTVTLPVYNTVTNTWQQATIQQIVGGNIFQRLVTAGGDILVQGNDRVILVKQDAPAAVNIILPPAGARLGVPLTVKDIAGVAAANNLTLVPNGDDTIDGQAEFVLNDNYEAVTLNPVTAAGGPVGWWIG